jgi:hypothetical protein
MVQIHLSRIWAPSSQLLDSGPSTVYSGAEMDFAWGFASFVDQYLQTV